MCPLCKRIFKQNPLARFSHCTLSMSVPWNWSDLPVFWLRKTTLLPWSFRRPGFWKSSMCLTYDASFYLHSHGQTLHKWKTLIICQNQQTNLLQWQCYCVSVWDQQSFFNSGLWNYVLNCNLLETISCGGNKRPSFAVVMKPVIENFTRQSNRWNRVFYWTVRIFTGNDQQGFAMAVCSFMSTNSQQQSPHDIYTHMNKTKNMYGLLV